jgi:hypothetical protein
MYKSRTWDLSDIYTRLRWVPRLHHVEVQKPSGPSYLLAFQLLDGGWFQRSEAGTYHDYGRELNHDLTSRGRRGSLFLWISGGGGGTSADISRESSRAASFDGPYTLPSPDGKTLLDRNLVALDGIPIQVGDNLGTVEMSRGLIPSWKNGNSLRIYSNAQDRSGTLCRQLFPRP